MTDYWFKPKTYGYGAAPKTWKGWASIPVFMLAQFVLLWPWLLSPALAGEEPTTAGLVATFGLSAVLAAGFVWLCKVKTEGDWAWRWGDKDLDPGQPGR